MKEFHPQLSDLHRDHHTALALARLCETASRAGRTHERAAARREATDRFERVLEAHVAVVERLLLPSLAAAGELRLVSRARLEYAELHASMASPSREPSALARLAIALEACVRLEQDLLFPRAGWLLSVVALAAIGAASERRRTSDRVMSSGSFEHHAPI